MVGVGIKPPRLQKEDDSFKASSLQDIFKIINNAAPFVHKVAKLFLRQLATITKLAAV